MRVLIWIASLEPTTEQHPPALTTIDNKLSVKAEWEKNMVSSLSSHMLMLLIALTVWEGFMRTSWHLIMNTNIVTRKALFELRRLKDKLSQGKLVDSSCEMSLSRLAIQSVSPREFPLRRVSLWLSFMVLLSLKTLGALSSRKPPKIPVVYTWDLAPWTAMSLGKLYGILKCPWRSSMRTKGWFWSSCPLAYTILIYIHHLSGKTVSYMYCTSLQSCPLNK